MNWAFYKRFLDIVISGIALIILSPLLGCIAVLIWLDDGGPVLFRQQRIGKEFKPFSIFKFRSMRIENEGPLITVSQDVRITRMGRILRRTKIDELPQLLNVVRGDMSLVGPRPEVHQYVELFRNRYERVLKVRPGVTDLASVRYFDEESILAGSADPLREYVDRVLPEKLKLADEYVENTSVSMDASILFRTLRLLLPGKKHHAQS